MGKEKWVAGRKNLQDRASSMGAQFRDDYANRIKQRMEAAKQTSSVSGELEKQEQALFEKLKNTYNTEKKMVEELQKINMQSPVKKVEPNHTLKNYNAGDKYIQK